MLILFATYDTNWPIEFLRKIRVSRMFSFQTILQQQFVTYWRDKISSIKDDRNGSFFFASAFFDLHRKLNMNVSAFANINKYI